MAGRIKGITIEINGETKGLEKSLSGITKQSVAVGKELKDVEKLLKFDPGNTELVTQKQELLAKQIDLTSQKLDGLKSAQAQVQAQFDKGELGEEQYRAFNREVEATEQILNGFKGQLANLQTEQERLAQNTNRLETLFEATGSSVDDYSDILGTKLVNAIKEGRASSDQLETAINKIGRASAGADADIGKIKTALDKIDDGGSISDVRQELDKLGDQSDDTSNQLEDMSNKMSGELFMGTAEQIANIGDKVTELGKLAVDMSNETGSATGNLQAAFGLTKEEAESLTEVAKNIYHKGFGESLGDTVEAVKLVKTNMENLDDTELGNITEQAMVLEQVFGSDMNETLRGANSLMSTYGLSAQEAMDLIVVGSQKGLDKTGELGDNLAEYAPLFQDSGYSAEEMFAILEAGLDGGAYNLDKVNDLVKEFGIRMSDGSVGTAVEDLGGNFQSLFKEIQDGGLSNKDAFQLMASEISNLGTEQEKAAAISAIFGSQGEDAGLKVIDAMQKANTTLSDNKKAYEDAGGAAQKMNDDSTTPLQELQGSINELKDSLAPLGQIIIDALGPIIEVITGIAEAIAGMPEWVQGFIVALGAVLAVVAVVVPIIAALGAAAAATGVTIGVFVTATLLPIIGIITAIIGVIMAIILAIQNWGAITDWLSEKWNAFKVWIGELWTSIKENASQIWDSIKTAIVNKIVELVASGKEKIDGLKNWLSQTWDNIKNTASSVWSSIKETISKPINAAKDAVRDAIETIKGLFNFEFKWPKLKMPHFSISGSMNPLKWLEQGVPKISVDWFAKGGILTKPTVFGTNGGSLMAGGEAGKEAVAPLETLMGYIRAAVSESGGTDPALIAAIMALANRPVELKINGKAFAEAVQEEVAIVLEEYKNKKAWENGYRSVKG